jgi:hypothetical protein
MNTGISVFYSEFTAALTEVLAEHAVGPARRGRLARARAAVKKHPEYNEHEYFLAVETAVLELLSAYRVKGYKKIAVVGEDYSFVYKQVMGLTVEYCKAGGEITKRFWVPLGTEDFASVISSLPDDVDAIYLGLGGADAVNFLNQYQQAGGQAPA